MPTPLRRPSRAHPEVFRWPRRFVRPPGRARGSPIPCTASRRPSLKAAVTPTTPTVAPLASLLVRNGPLKGKRLPVKVPIVNVGRADYNDVVLRRSQREHEPRQAAAAGRRLGAERRGIHQRHLRGERAGDGRGGAESRRHPPFRGGVGAVGAVRRADRKARRRYPPGRRARRAVRGRRRAQSRQRRLPGGRSIRRPRGPVGPRHGCSGCSGLVVVALAYFLLR